MPIDPREFEQAALDLLDSAARFARSLTGDATEAEDLVQESYLKAIAARDRYIPGDAGMRPWLFRIIRNTWMNRVARKRLEPTAVSADSMETLPATGATPPQVGPSIDWSQCDQRLVAAVQALPETLRSPLLLWALEEMTYREIAEIAEVPVGTIMSRLHRARQLLIERLQPLTQDERRRNE